jgi:hypothetical protein
LTGWLGKGKHFLQKFKENFVIKGSFYRIKSYFRYKNKLLSKKYIACRNKDALLSLCKGGFFYRAYTKDKLVD